MDTLTKCLDTTDLHLALSSLWKEHFDPVTNQKSYDGVGTNFKVEMLDQYSKMLLGQMYEKVLDDPRLKLDKVFPIRCSPLETYKEHVSLVKSLVLEPLT